MDFWIIAAATAATGAGYVAKCYWHKWFSREREGVADKSGDDGDELTESSGELVSDFVVAEKAGFLFHQRLEKSRCLGVKSKGHSLKALNYTESCLLAQVVLYGENARVEEDVYSPSCASPCILALRPFLVNNGSQVNDVWLESEEKARWRQERRRRRCSGSTKPVAGSPFDSQGSKNGLLLFFVGITIRAIHTISARKREVDKLNELLKQTQKLVQSLHEEERFKFQGTEKQIITSFDVRESERSNIRVAKRLDDQMEDGVEAMRKIEAELLAELEILEESTHEEINKGVSPQELSLRLYEVVESRLEARIMELEAALEASEKKVRLMDLVYVRNEAD
ncbi:hypothetical protein ACFX1Z_020819 [Malus domestica]